MRSWVNSIEAPTICNNCDFAHCLVHLSHIASTTYIRETYTNDRSIERNYISITSILISFIIDCNSPSTPNWQLDCLPYEHIFRLEVTESISTNHWLMSTGKCWLTMSLWPAHHSFPPGFHDPERARSQNWSVRHDRRQESSHRIRDLICKVGLERPRHLKSKTSKDYHQLLIII